MMDKVFIYDNYKHLGKNPPQHNAVDSAFNGCDMLLSPQKVSAHEIIQNDKVILEITGVCPIHGVVSYYVRFIK